MPLTHNNAAARTFKTGSNFVNVNIHFAHSFRAPTMMAHNFGLFETPGKQQKVRHVHSADRSFYSHNSSTFARLANNKISNKIINKCLGMDEINENFNLFPRVQSNSRETERRLKTKSVQQL